MKRYWILLHKEPLLRQLSFIQLISYFGAWFSNVAIYTLLIHMDVSPSIIAMVAALHFFSGVLQAPFSGPLIDRFHPKKIMLLLTLMEIICTLLLIQIDEVSMLPLLYTLVFIRMGAASFQFTVEMSLLPKIVSGKDLQSANEIHSIIWSLSYTLGMALSGIVVYGIGTTAAFLLDAGLFMIVLLMLLQIRIEVTGGNNQTRFVTMMVDALRYIKQERIVLHLMLVHAVVAFTAFDALVALSVQQYYSSLIAVSLGIGLVHAFRAIGLSIGPVLLGGWINVRRLELLFIAEAGAIALWALVLPNFYLSLIASFFVGFLTTTMWSYTYTLLQEHVDYDFYGRVVAYNDMIFLSVGGLVSLLIGYLVQQGVSLSGVTLVLGSAFVFAAIYYRWIRTQFQLKEIGDEQ